MSVLTEYEKSYGEALVGVDSQSLANDPLAKALDKLSADDKKMLADIMKTAADKALEYYRNKQNPSQQ